MAHVVIDLTGVAVAAIATVFPIMSVVVTNLIKSHMKDQKAADTLSAAILNSLGAIQQALTNAVNTSHPTIAGIPDHLAPGVQYVLDHAGEEATRLGITPEMIADKISAQIGLKNIDAAVANGNQAITTAASPPKIVKPNA